MDKILSDILDYFKNDASQENKEKQSQPGQKIINCKDTVTALTFKTYEQNCYLVVAEEKNVKFYDNVAFNQGSKQNQSNQNALDSQQRQDISQDQGIQVDLKFTYDFTDVLKNDNDTITAILFPEPNYDEKLFFIGTKKGKFLYVFFQPKNKNNLIIVHDKQRPQFNQDQEQQVNQESDQNQKEDLFLPNYGNISLHSGQISCIQQVKGLKSELVILTGSYDSQIKQFRVDFTLSNEKGNQLELKDEEVLKHGSKEGVFWLSLSDPDNTKQRLISSGYENNFYIWERNTNSFKWQFILKYNRNAFGARVAYFGSDFIVWQMFKQNYVNILLNLNTSKLSHVEVAQDFKPENIRKAQVNEQYNDNKIERYDTDKFPLLYNKEKEKMAIKFGNRIYFLLCKVQQPSKEGFHNTAQLLSARPELSFNYLQEYIECSLDCTEGAMSPKGDVLAVYDSYQKKVIIYRLTFF